MLLTNFTSEYFEKMFVECCHQFELLLPCSYFFFGWTTELSAWRVDLSLALTFSSAAYSLQSFLCGRKSEKISESEETHEDTERTYLRKPIITLYEKEVRLTMNVSKLKNQCVMAQHGIFLNLFGIHKDCSVDIPAMTVRFPSSTTSGSRDREESITFPSRSRPYTRYTDYTFHFDSSKV